MRYDDKYPDKINPQKVFPDKLLGPHKEVWVAKELAQSWRVYPCIICKQRTGWRYKELPICSEECRGEYEKSCEKPDSDDNVESSVESQHTEPQ